MRIPIVALAALTFGGALACSAGTPTEPAAASLTSPEAASSPGRLDPLDISGSWMTSPFFLLEDWAPGSAPDPFTIQFVRCESYAIIENEGYNSLLLTQSGTRIVGTSRPGMGITCRALTPDGEFIDWFIDIDDSFEGRVEGGQVRLALNKYMEVRVRPNPEGGDSWVGTIRVRMDPRPYGEPYWFEGAFGLRSTADLPCPLVHLEPPHCIAP